MLTRRALLAIAPTLAAAATANLRDLRNQLCEAANAFHEPYTDWAQRMNDSRDKSQTVPAPAVQAFQPLGELWRNVERKFRAWLRGY